MAGTLSDGWNLLKQSGRVLGADRGLLLFPLAGMLSAVGVFAAFLVPLFGCAIADGDAANDSPGPLLWIALFALHVCTWFVVSFWNAGLSAVVIDRFRGADATVSSGVKVASRRIPQLFAWSVVAATVGLVLGALERRAGLIGRLVVRFLGAAWAITTWFVVPVIVSEQATPGEAIRRSLDLMKNNWGTAIVASSGMNLIVFGFTLLAFLPAGVGGLLTAQTDSPAPLTIGVLASGVAVMLLVLVASALRTIQTAALYELASRGAAPEGFDADLLRRAFRTK